MEIQNDFFIFGKILFMDKLTATQYAAAVDCSPSHITKKLAIKKELPGASTVEKFGNTWVITITPALTKSALKKLFKNN